MNIVISVNNGEEVAIIPVVPPDIEISEPWNNEEKDSVKYGKVNTIGLQGLRTFKLDSFFPVNKNYGFVKSGAWKDGKKYIDFFKRWRVKRVPFRVVITGSDNSEVLNLPMTVESLTYSFDKAGDIKYSLEFKEYIFIK